MKLSYRDKILLIIVTVLLTLGLGYIGLIKPKLDDIKSNKDLLSSVTAQKESIETQIATLPGLNAKLAATQENLNTLSKKFFPLQQSFETDRYIQGIIKDDKLKISLLDISDLSSSILDFYITEEDSSEVPTENAEAENPEETAVVGQGETLKSRTVNISYSGKLSDLAKFLDRIIYSAEHTSLVVNSVTCTSLDNADLTGSISMTIYYMERLTPVV